LSTRSGHTGSTARWLRVSAIAALAVISTLMSPWVAVSAAQAGGADKPRPGTFGDCKNHNAGVHNGYDCEEEPVPSTVGEGGEEGGGGLT